MSALQVLTARPHADEHDRAYCRYCWRHGGRHFGRRGLSRRGTPPSGARHPGRAVARPRARRAVLGARRSRRRRRCWSPSCVTLAVIADHHDVPLPSGIRFDATIALALIALAVAGPATTLLLLTGADGGERADRARAPVARRQPRQRRLASRRTRSPARSRCTLLPMEATAATALPWLVAIGFAPARPSTGSPARRSTARCGSDSPMRVLTRMLLDAIPAGGVMLALGALAIVATPAVGLAALAGFALIAVLPQSALTFAMRTRSVSRLETRAGDPQLRRRARRPAPALARRAPPPDGGRRAARAPARQRRAARVRDRDAARPDRHPRGGCRAHPRALGRHGQADRPARHADPAQLARALGRAGVGLAHRRRHPGAQPRRGARRAARARRARTSTPRSSKQPAPSSRRSA